MTDYNEKTRVQLPNAATMMGLGWKYIERADAKISSNTMRIAPEIFKFSLERINNTNLSMEEVIKIIDAIERVCSKHDKGEAFHKWLLDPNCHPIGVFDNSKPLKLIDFDNYNNNEFNVILEVSFGEKGVVQNEMRTDINAYVNGIPLSFIEDKIPDNEGGIQVEFDRYRERMTNNVLRPFFNMAQIISATNNMKYEDGDLPVSERKQGSFYATNDGKDTEFQLWREECEEQINYELPSDDDILTMIVGEDKRKIPEEKKFSDAAALLSSDEFRYALLMKNSPANQFLASIYDIQRFMNILKYGIIYKHPKDEPIQKHILRYPQYRGIYNLCNGNKKTGFIGLDHGGKSGTLFHGQGTGKTEEAAMMVKVIKDYCAEHEILGRFFFFADRNPLTSQAFKEFKQMGFHVQRIKTKQDLLDLVKSSKTSSVDDLESNGITIYVANVQLLGEDFSKFKKNNPYKATIQNIFIVDEAHRSQKKNGKYYTSLCSIDPEAIMIAMTGTPLLKRNELTKDKFGKYIDIYFYKDSIRDGFTVPITRHAMKTIEGHDIKRNIEVIRGQLDKKDVYMSEEYIDSICSYIDHQFTDYRFRIDDDTIGGYIVANSRQQALKIEEWFKKNSDLSAKAIVSRNDDYDYEDDEEVELKNDENADAFKNGELDFVIVYKMLTEGFNAPRAKAMYLLQKIKDHSLLQLITRLNRLYNGHRYGLLVDFVDIEEAYEKTIDEYLTEILTAGDDDIDENELEALKEAYEGIFVDADKIQEDIDEAYDIIALDIRLDFNKEKIQQQIDRRDNAAELNQLRRALKVVLAGETNLRNAGDDEKADAIDVEKIEQVLKMVELRIHSLNTKSEPSKTLTYLNNDQIIDVVYEFVREKEETLAVDKIDDAQRKVVSAQQNEYICANMPQLIREIGEVISHDEEERVLLDDAINDIMSSFERKDIKEAISKLEATKQKVSAKKKENDELLSDFGNNHAFASTYKQVKTVQRDYDPRLIYDTIKIIYGHYDEMKQSFISCNEDDFVAKMKKLVSRTLLKQKVSIDGEEKNLRLASGYNEWGDGMLRTLYLSLNS